jgi:6-phosphofructokinase 2
LSIYAQLARIAREKGSKLVVDTSGEALKQAAMEGVYLLKPNLGELSTLAGLERIDTTKIEATAKAVINQYKCEIIVVSLGADGAVLVTPDKTYQVKPPPVERKSTVGAGDSMVAGIVYSLAGGKDLEQALQFGVACGTAATMNRGTELCRRKDVDRLYSLMTQ